MSGATLILGASSGMGRALALELAERGGAVILAGRREDDLERIATDCRVRHGAEAYVEPFDALACDTHPAFYARCAARHPGGLDGVILCHGEMVDEAEARAQIASTRRMVEVNLTSAFSLLELAAADLEARGTGFIAAISSVAGDRGRPSNYTYGATKAGLSTFVAGLRARLAKRGVRVVDVKPGFVDTGMTFGRPGLFLVASPASVAQDILRGIERDKAVVYTPWFWKWIMLIIRMIPDFVFKRIDL